MNTTGTGIPKPDFSVDPNTNRMYAPSDPNHSYIDYDAAGNQTKDFYTGGGARTFDAENRMTSAQAATIWNYYTYDGEGFRVRRKLNGVETWQIYGLGGEVVAEYAANGATNAPQKEYGYRGGQLLVTATSGTDVEWIVADQLGTPRMVMDKTGSLASTKRHDYLPFGEELTVNQGGRTSTMGYGAVDTRQKFTGYERDAESGLDYAHARYYSSMQGRFTSPDPFAGSAKIDNPQTFNRYGYVTNNPINSTDPTGLYESAHGNTNFGNASIEVGSRSMDGGSGSEWEEMVEGSEQGDVHLEHSAEGAAPEHSAEGEAPEHSDHSEETADHGDPQNPVTPQAPPQELGQQRGGPEWIPHIERTIKFQKDAISAYSRYGRTAKTVEELESMVVAELSRLHGHIGVAGSTDPTTAKVQIADDPDPYTKEATRRHEDVHHQTVLRAIARYGVNTPAFQKWRANPQIWAADEVKAYSAGIRYLEQSLLRLSAFGKR